MGRATSATLGAARRVWLLALALLLLASDAAAQTLELAPQLRTQLRAALAEKAARTHAQRKIGSRLLFASRERRGRAPIAGMPATMPPLRRGVRVAADGTVLVDVRADVTDRLLEWIDGLGGRVVASHPRYRSVRAHLPVRSVELLADLPEVAGIRPADRAFTRMLDVSEGVVAHRADLARSAFGVDGTGVSVGVLSDGVDSLAALQASGDLPPVVTILPGQAGNGTEGTAMLEIIHDVAPGAALLFATAFGGEAAFAANIQALRAAGADVIVDDVGYFAEAVFQDDIIAEAVDIVTADGALYFSSAGNSGNLNDGTAGVFEGDFVDSGNVIQITFPPDPPVSWDSADFGEGATTNVITADSPFLFTLHWADPIGGSANDYDLFLVNPAGTTLFALSTDFQNGDDDPFEAIDSSFFDDTGNLLLIGKWAGDDRFLHLNANRGDLAIVTDGQTSGHSAARSAFSVAAVDVASAGGAGGVFDGTEPVEPFSSDGPRRVFFEADGTPITPGDFSSTGGELRQKPDIAAADCVSTATPGFAIFCGTSAAAPHAAAIAALLLERGGLVGATAEEIEDALRDTALDIEAPGVDRDSGVGIVDALDAADAIPVPEPSRTLQLAAGLAGLASLRRLRRARER